MNTEESLDYIKNEIQDLVFNEKNFIWLKDIAVRGLNRERDLYLSVEKMRNEMNTI